MSRNDDFILDPTAPAEDDHHSRTESTQRSTSAVLPSPPNFAPAIQVPVNSSNFNVETAVGVLYSNPLLRRAVLSYTDVKRCRGTVRLLREAFQEVRSKVPLSCNLAEFFEKKPSPAAYAEDFMKLLVVELPQVSSDVFTGSTEDIESMKEDIANVKENIKNSFQFTAFSKTWCRCGSERYHSHQAPVLQLIDGKITKTLENFSLNAEIRRKEFLRAQKQWQICEICKSEVQASKMEIILPDFPLLRMTTRWTNVSEKMTTEYGVYEFHYITKQPTPEGVYIHAQRTGTRELMATDVQRLLEDDEHVPVLLQMRQIESHLDPHTFRVVSAMDNPPERFRNYWGVCVLIAYSSCFATMPKDVREKFKELELNPGEVSDPRVPSLVFDLVDQAEKEAAKQKSEQWKSIPEMPYRLLAHMLLLKKLGGSQANPAASLSITSGIDVDLFTEGVFGGHVERTAFKEFAQYRRITNQEDLITEEEMARKPVNIFNVHSKLAGEIFNPEMFVDLKPKGSTLNLVVRENEHVFLLHFGKDNMIMEVNDDRISVFPKLPEEHRKIAVILAVCIRKEDSLNQVHHPKEHVKPPTNTPLHVSSDSSTARGSPLDENNSTAASDLSRRWNMSIGGNVGDRDIEDFLNRSFSTDSGECVNTKREDGDMQRNGDECEEDMGRNFEWGDQENDMSQAVSSPNFTVKKTKKKLNPRCLQRLNGNLLIWDRHREGANILRTRGKSYICHRRLTRGAKCGKQPLPKNSDFKELLKYANVHLGCKVWGTSKMAKVGSKFFCNVMKQWANEEDVLFVNLEDEEDIDAQEAD